MHCQFFNLGSMAIYSVTTLPYLSLHICELTDCCCVVGSNKFNTGNKTVFCMQYIFFSKTKLVYVTNFTCILCRNYLYAVYFCFVLVVMGHSWQYAESEDRYSKKSCQLRKKLSMTSFINPFKSAYDSTVQDLSHLTAKINQK